MISESVSRYLPFWHRGENFEGACDTPEEVSGQFQNCVEGYRGRRHDDFEDEEIAGSSG